MNAIKKLTEEFLTVSTKKASESEKAINSDEASAKRRERAKKMAIENITRSNEKKPTEKETTEKKRYIFF